MNSWRGGPSNFASRTSRFTAADRRYRHVERAALSAIGTKRASLVALHMSAFGGRADMTFCTAHVCF